MANSTGRCPGSPEKQADTMGAPPVRLKWGLQSSVRLLLFDLLSDNSSECSPNPHP